MDEFMGFASPNYTQTPNDFFDDLLKEVDELSELKVTLVALRQTFGFHRDQALLSITFIERMSGLSRSAVKHGIKMAVRRGTLKLARKQTSRSPADEDRHYQSRIRGI